MTICYVLYLLGLITMLLKSNWYSTVIMVSKVLPRVSSCYSTDSERPYPPATELHWDSATYLIFPIFAMGWEMPPQQNCPFPWDIQAFTQYMVPWSQTAPQSVQQSVIISQDLMKPVYFHVSSFLFSADCRPRRQTHLPSDNDQNQSS